MTDSKSADVGSIPAAPANFLLYSCFYFVTCAFFSVMINCLHYFSGGFFMLIVETIKDFLLANNLVDDFIIQAFQWKERENNEDAKYLVIKQDAGGQFDTIFNDTNLSLVFIGSKNGGQLSLARECEKVKRFIVNAVYNDVWAFDVIGQPQFYLSKDERVIFELNIKCRAV